MKSGEQEITIIDEQILRDLAPKTVLRAAINVGNTVLARRRGLRGELTGVTVDLARALADRLAVPVELIAYDAAGKVFEAVGD